MFRAIPFQILTCLLCLALGQPAFAYLLQIDAQHFTEFHGKDQRNYSFFAVHNGELTSVVHQWLDQNTDGLPYFEKDESAKAAGKAGVLDKSDLLLLRKDDAGQKLSARTTEKVVAELKLTSGSETYYFYMVENAYQQSTKRYVKFDPVKGVVKSTNYALFMDPDNIFIWNDFFYRGFVGRRSKKESILDTMKVRISAGVFTKDQRITLTNESLKPTIEEIIEGPLVTAVYVKTTVYVSRIPVSKMQNYFLLMPNQVSIHSRFKLPTIAKTVLRSPSASISMDGNGLYGGKLYTSWTGKNQAVTDGEMSRAEKQMIGQKISGSQWLSYSTGRGMDLLVNLDFREGFDQPVTLLYEDDANLENKPERFKGQLPNVGFNIQELPIGKEFYFLTDMIFSENSDNLSAPRFAQKTLNPPEVEFKLWK